MIFFGKPVSTFPDHALEYKITLDRKVPNLFQAGGSTMAAGIFRDVAQTERVADFSYAPNDSLAQMIVDAWVDQNFASQLLNNPGTAKSALAQRGIYLASPVVITEAQFTQGYTPSNPNVDVIFVLPNQPRVDMTPPPGQSLLETARLLMASTPNGI
jgi:hypothetical protein